MKISYLRNETARVSFQNSTWQDQGQLKRAIRHFLSSISGTPQRTNVCPRCGQPMEYVDTVFRLYGEDISWNVRLPVCACVAKPNDL